MKGCDKVIHLAAVSINKSQADPYESVDINMVGSNNVFAAAADHGVSRVVYASSASVYGDPETLPMTEDGPAQPADPVLHRQAAPASTCWTSTRAARA